MKDRDDGLTSSDGGRRKQAVSRLMQNELLSHNTRYAGELENSLSDNEIPLPKDANIVRRSDRGVRICHITVQSRI